MIRTSGNIRIPGRVAKSGLMILFALGIAGLGAQDLRLRKGTVLNGAVLNDSLFTDLALYLPQQFSGNSSSPLLFVVGKADPVQSVRYFQQVAEQYGYMVAASAIPGDTVSLTQQILHVNQVIRALVEKFPINRSQVVVGGFGQGGQLASLLPQVIPEITGVLLLGAVPLEEAYKQKNSPPVTVVVMGRGDFGYSDMRYLETTLLRRNKYFSVQYVEGGHEYPMEAQLGLSFEALEVLHRKATGDAVDMVKLKEVNEGINIISSNYKSKGLWILAHHLEEFRLRLFQEIWDVEGLERDLKLLARTPAYRVQQRQATLIQYKEQQMRNDLTYNLQEDLDLLNFNNLGWWRYQFQEFQKLQKGSVVEDRYYASRIQDYLNALADDYLRLTGREEGQDLPAMLWLNMLKTITAPTVPEHYLNVISLACRLEDQGTALYYLEALLQQGYTEESNLYTIPGTGLLRIKPAYNNLIAKYLGTSRYKYPEEPNREQLKE